MDKVLIYFTENENIDFESLYPGLKEADPETLLAVTKRVLSTDQFLPRWFLLRYMVSLLFMLFLYGQRSNKHRTLFVVQFCSKMYSEH